MTFRLTIMGGSEIRLQGDTNFVMTIMGGSDIILPTVAEKIVSLRRAQTHSGANLDAGPRRITIVTVMGGTELKRPTIAQEIEDMIRLRQSRALSDSEFLQLWHEVIRRGDEPIIESYTLMGGVGEGTPSTKNEIKDLERIAARGFLSAQELQEIKAMIQGDSFPAMRVSLLQQRLQTLLAPPQPSPGYRTNPIETSRLEDRGWPTTEDRR